MSSRSRNMDLAAPSQEASEPVRIVRKRARWPFRLTVLGVAIASIALWAGIVALFNLH